MLEGEVLSSSDCIVAFDSLYSVLLDDSFWKRCGDGVVTARHCDSNLAMLPPEDERKREDIVSKEEQKRKPVALTEERIDADENRDSEQAITGTLYIDQQWGDLGSPYCVEPQVTPSWSTN